MPTPKSLRELKAKMVLKGLSLREVARRADVEYYRASEILNGRRNDAKRLTRLSTAINDAEEVAA